MDLPDLNSGSRVLKKNEIIDMKQLGLRGMTKDDMLLIYEKLYTPSIG